MPLQFTIEMDGRAVVDEAFGPQSRLDSSLDQLQALGRC